MPAELEVTARTEGGVIMGVQHVELPIHGVQFHPESILTEGGHRMLANWLGSAARRPTRRWCSRSRTKSPTRWRARYDAKLSVIVLSRLTPVPGDGL